MTKRNTKLSKSQLEQSLIDIATIVQHPHGEESDKILDKIVWRYNEGVYKQVAAEGQILHPGWPAWQRLLQVRFIQVGCADNPKLAAVISAAVANDRHTEINHLMREVLRHSFIDAKAWDGKGMPPKGANIYWQEATEALKEDLSRQRRLGKQIEDAPKAWYAIMGADYRLVSATK